MNVFRIRLKKRIKQAGLFVLVFGAAGLVLLYFLGYYDFAFIDRYVDRYRFLYEDSQRSSAGSLAESLASLIDLSEVTEAEAGSRGQETDENASRLPEEADAAPKEAQTPRYTSAAKVYDTARLTDEETPVETVAALEQRGYETADGVYDYVPGQTVLGKMTFRFPLPEPFCLRKRTVERVNVREGPDDTGYYTEITEEREDRPAVETYMGYILIDKGSELYLLSSDGEPLCRFQATRYEPAYERDREGRPLFRRETEDGEYAYFYLTETGTNFASSDFRPGTDSRGLKFDYPADFGLSDSTVVYADRDQTTGLFGYLVKPSPTPETEPEEPLPEAAEAAEEAAEPEKPKEEPKPAKLTKYVFTSAFPFTANRAAVTTSANRGALFYINENGQEAFGGLKSYYNVYDRYVTEILLPPLTDGAESLGFYYFDHGLTRVRRQIFDWWNWYYRSRLRVVEDRDLLLRTDGSIYELPAGYELEAYSEGMLMLSKNGAVGFTDYTGEWIAQPIFADAEPFIQGLAVLTAADGRKGMIDTAGNIVLPFAYDALSPVSSGLIAAYREESGWSVFRLMKPADSD